MAADDQEITEYATSLFLRYFRAGSIAGIAGRHVDLERDLDLLRTHWAISAPTRAFLRYLLEHRHEAQSLLQFASRTDDAVARGRIDARATLVLRARSGHPALMVAQEPLRTFDTGPNQVVAWVVHHVSVFVERLFNRQFELGDYGPLVEGTMADLAAVRRLDALREPLKHVSSNRRPAPGALRDAARSRRPLYRHAVAAYLLLIGVERGDRQALRSVLESTVIAPLEVWRRYELAVAMGIGLALARRTREPLELSLLAATSRAPLLRCGRFSVHWQQATTLFNAPEQEPSEVRLQTVLNAFGLPAATDRPDLIVTDERECNVCAIVEVKYLAGDTATARFREAAAQIVRYARGYATSEAGISQLIGRSLIALNSAAPQPVASSEHVPCSMDFRAIQDGALEAWVYSTIVEPSM